MLRNGPLKISKSLKKAENGPLAKISSQSLDTMWTDGQTVWFLYTSPNFVCGGIVIMIELAAIKVHHLNVNLYFIQIWYSNNYDIIFYENISSRTDKSGFSLTLGFAGESCLELECVASFWTYVRSSFFTLLSLYFVNGSVVVLPIAGPSSESSHVPLLFTSFPLRTIPEVEGPGLPLSSISSQDTSDCVHLFLNNTLVSLLRISTMGQTRMCF